MEDNQENKIEEIDHMRNHISSVLEQTWGVLLVLGAILLNNSANMRDIAKIVEKGVVWQYLLVLAGVFVFFIIVCLWNLNRWYKTTITVKDGTVVIERRTMNRYINTIAVQNISNINLEQNLFEMVMGTYKLKMDTSSLSTANKTDVKIILKKKDAYAVKNLIMKMMKQIQMETELEFSNQIENEETTGTSLSGDVYNDLMSNAQDKEIDFMDDEKEQDYDISYTDGEIIRHCAYSTSILLVVIAVGSLISAIVSVVVTRGSGASIASVIGAVLIQVILAGSMLTTIVKSWLADYGFRAKRYKNKIYVSCGLLKKRKYAVPVEKINAVMFYSTLIGRIAKRYFVKVINVGGEDEDVDGMQVLLSGKPEELKKQLAILLPELEVPDIMKVQRQPLRVVVKNICLGVGILVVIGAVLFEVIPVTGASVKAWGINWFWVGIIGITILFVVMRVLSYHTRGMHMSEQYLILANGSFARNVTVIPYDKIQYITLNQGPLERLLHVQRADISILASAISQKHSSGAFSIEDFNMLEKCFEETF